MYGNLRRHATCRTVVAKITLAQNAHVNQCAGHLTHILRECHAKVQRTCQVDAWVTYVIFDEYYLPQIMYRNADSILCVSDVPSGRKTFLQSSFRDLEHWKRI